MIKSCVYEIRLTRTRKRYIGQAVNFDRRWAEHRRMLSQGVHHCKALQDAWLTHGEENFTFKVLKAVHKSSLNEVEQSYLDAATSGTLYNTQVTVGSWKGSKFSADHRKKMVAAFTSPAERERRSLQAKAQHAARSFGRQYKKESEVCQMV